MSDHRLERYGYGCGRLQREKQEHGSRRLVSRRLRKETIDRWLDQGDSAGLAGEIEKDK